MNETSRTQVPEEADASPGVSRSGPRVYLDGRTAVTSETRPPVVTSDLVTLGGPLDEETLTVTHILPSVHKLKKMEHVVVVVVTQDTFLPSGVGLVDVMTVVSTRCSVPDQSTVTLVRTSPTGCHPDVHT